jgi:hypothetical protein
METQTSKIIPPISDKNARIHVLLADDHDILRQD